MRATSLIKNLEKDNYMCYVVTSVILFTDADRASLINVKLQGRETRNMWSFEACDVSLANGDCGMGRAKSHFRIGHKDGYIHTLFP